jgi:hypothetical protein
MAAKGWKRINGVWIEPGAKEAKLMSAKKQLAMSTQVGISKYPKLFVREADVDTKTPGEVSADSDVKAITEDMIVDAGYEEVTIIEYHPVAIRKYKRSVVEIK